MKEVLERDKAVIMNMQFDGNKDYHRIKKDLGKLNKFMNYHNYKGNAHSAQRKVPHISL